MNTRKEEIIAQIEPVLSQYQYYIKNFVDPWADHGPYTTIEESSYVFNSLLATIQRFSLNNSPYYQSALKISQKFPDPDIRHLRDYIQALAGILQSLKEAHQNNYLSTLQELFHADIFGDFLEMAEHLLESNYKDPAAVMIGSVLEEHLRKICSKCEIPVTTIKDEMAVHKKSDLLNSELEKQGVYNKVQQKQITAWLGIRNNAAHGNYTEYSREQIKIMLTGVRDFILKYPA
jgi:hypothetical protein